ALLERAADQTGGARRDPRARAIERLHRHLEAAVLGADERALRHLDVLEDHVRRVRRTVTHLVLLAARLDTRRAGVDDEAGNALVLHRGVERREHGVPARDPAVRDPALL